MALNLWSKQGKTRELWKIHRRPQLKARHSPQNRSNIDKKRRNCKHVNMKTWSEMKGLSVVVMTGSGEQHKSQTGVCLWLYFRVCVRHFLCPQNWREAPWSDCSSLTIEGSLLAPLMNSSKDNLPVTQKPKKDSQSEAAAAVEHVMMMGWITQQSTPKNLTEIFWYSFSLQQTCTNIFNTE